MTFNTPDIYTKPYISLDSFSGFDVTYEKENMPSLIAKGWPVNWNYVGMNNIVPVCASLVKRSLGVDAPAIYHKTIETAGQVKDKALGLLPSIGNQGAENIKTTTHEA